MAVDSLTRQLDNLYMTTWESVYPETINNVFEKTPLWAWWTQKSKVKFVRGGSVLEYALEYGENPTVKTLSKGEKLSMQEADFLRPARYDWTYIGGLLLNFFTDRQKNRGKHVRLDWIQQKVQNLRMSLTKQMEILLFARDAETDSESPWGLQSAIAADPTAATTNKFGGIDQSTTSYWRNQTYALQGAADVNLKADMRHLHNLTQFLGTVPDVGIMDVDSLELLEDVTEEQKLIVNQQVGDAVFKSILFRGMPLFWSPQAPANEIRFLNSDHIFPVLDPDFVMQMMDWQTLEASVEDKVAPIVTALQICSTNRKTSGVLTAVS